MKLQICLKELCTGCFACFNVCPTNSITMSFDLEGFFQPIINHVTCIECELCRQICPAANFYMPAKSPFQYVYCSFNRDDRIRLHSSSGGIFFPLAQRILDDKGIVFGAAFDKNMSVKHFSCSNEFELSMLMGSKYVQSNIGYAYYTINKLLSENIKVMFVGTPCQVAALYSIIGIDHADLITCDIICKGVPSTELFSKYIQFLESRTQKQIININFRDKRNDWNMPLTVATFADNSQRILNGIENSFMHGYGKNLTLRRSCYRCVYATTNRFGDITLGDFWDIGRMQSFNYSTKHGVSLVLINTEKGHRLFKSILNQIYAEVRDLNEARPLHRSFQIPKRRNSFFHDYHHFSYEQLAKGYLLDNSVKSILKLIFPSSWLSYFKNYLKFFSSY